MMGISRISARTPWRSRRAAMRRSTAVTWAGSSTLGISTSCTPWGTIQSRSSRPPSPWLMRTMRSAPRKSTAAQGVAHHHAGGVLLRRRHRILQVEDHAVGPVQPGVDVELGLVARQVEAAAAQAVADGGLGGPGTGLGQQRGRRRDACPAHGALQPRGDHEGQRPLVLHRHQRVGHAQGAAARLDLGDDAVAVHGAHLALELDPHAQVVPQFDPDPAVGADLRPALARLSGLRHGCQPFAAHVRDGDARPPASPRRPGPEHLPVRT